MYEFTVGIHHPSEEEDDYPEEETRPLKDDPEKAEEE